ncbi:MAG: winged helix-turn-helix domain-containing protein [Candidatus Hodarchaeales archaeon]
MNSFKRAENEKVPSYDVNNIFQILSDPIKLGIIFEMVRRSNLTALEIKKKLNLSGSGIYYYLNQLIDANIIEETKIEKITSHLSRRRFKLTNWFIEVISDLRYDTKRVTAKLLICFNYNLLL